MKKVFTLVAVAGLFTFVACGPSAEDIAAAEKAKQDSIVSMQAQQDAEKATQEQVRLDSIAAANKVAEDAKAAEEAAKAEEEAKHKGKKK